MSEVTSTEAGHPLKRLPHRLALDTPDRNILASLSPGGEVILEGVWGAGCAVVAAAVAESVNRPILLVLPSLTQIEALAGSLAVFTDLSIATFPAWESSPDERLIRDDIYAARLKVLKTAAHQKLPRLVVTSIESLLQPVPSRDNILENSRRIQVGETVEAEKLGSWLLSHKYHFTSAVELPGEYSLRGGILDIFALDGDAPVRIEFFGDEIESIRTIDVATQRSVETLDQIEITALRHTKKSPGNFLDFVPEETILALVELEQMRQSADHYLERLEEVPEGFLLEDILRRANQFTRLQMQSLPSGLGESHFSLDFESVQRFSGHIDRVKGELDGLGQSNDVYLVCETEAEIERLDELLADSQIAKDGRLHLVQGSLEGGFRLRDQQIVVVSGNEIFHRATLPRTKARQLGKVIDSFVELNKGDLIVHLAHGIGRYRGLKLLEKGGQQEEHLELEFHGGTKVFVPTTKMDLVQKYVGGTKSRPPLAKIGGVSWKKQKENVERAVRDLAAELLEVQAARQSRPGISFAEDTHWQHEFDASFPYTPTPDQSAAIYSIKDDMRQPRPMDRLLCGDVGFGKTEVAMRAAFKAVDNGYQVAVLVPTTILAEQHYKSFRERMAEFPFTIERLSRFCTAAEQREIIKGLKDGVIDIVIGTHRLASQDVKFQNLGLLVIDEEQRFGVEVKEKLKQLRTTVDVLTMTATPIPRTLHMSLVGARDISNLEVAPKDRIAVETKVSRWGDELIRHAVMRELNRGGQTYFVHNRVQDIEVVAAKLQRIVPEATLAIGHGQMPENDLERVMTEFIAGKYDILLATTIVESGLDIPNANTIFIDEADRYGLADLHQLRGRVGRSNHRAYCYLLLDPRKGISPVAAKRLHAIEEFSHMGAGFAISMRDLEIRGAGNILGTQQSGHIASVGYELYCQLLESAVRKLRRLPPQMSIDVDIDLPCTAYLPNDYVPDMRQKIDLYRRMTRIASDEDLTNLREELEDRFGGMPAAVATLLRLISLKLDAAFWQVNSVTLEENFMVFTYTDSGRIKQLARHHGRNLRVVDDRQAYFPLPETQEPAFDFLEFARSVLQPI